MTEGHRESALRAASSVARADIENMLLLAGFTRAERDRAGSLAATCVTALLDDLRPLGLSAEGGCPNEPTAAFNRMIAAGLARTHDFWREHCVATGQRLACALWGSDDPSRSTIERLRPRRFRVDLSRRFDLSCDAGRGRGRGRGRGPLRLRLPLPIESNHLRALEVVADCPGAEIRIASDRIEAKIATDAPEAIVSARFTFEAHAGLALPATEEPAAIASWLEAVERPIQVTPAIRAEAARAERGASSPRDRVQALFDYLLDDVKIGMVRYDARASSQPIGWQDCRLASARLVSLCRAIGIPARLVSGYLLWDAPTEHYWMEALIEGEGWTPFDFLAWDLSAGGSITAWRGVYAGAVDYRMKTQCLPHAFTGSPGIAMGKAWQRLYRSVPGGTETRYVAADDGRLLYAETVCVTPA